MEWITHTPTRQDADTDRGTFVVEPTRTGSGFRVVQESGLGRWHEHGVYPTLDDAKRAAEAHYERLTAEN